MRGQAGYVDAEGNSAVPEGIVDLAALGEDLTLDAEIEEKLHNIWKEVQTNTKLKAKYKLEVAFTEDRSMHKPFSGFVVALSNGGFAHGGGDEAVYFCTAKIDRDGRSRTCNNPLDLKWVGKTAAVCPKCRNVVDPKNLCGQIYAKLPMQHWATLVTQLFKILDCNADIRIGAMRGDIRRATQQEQARERQGEHLRAVRTQREWGIYPLENIIKDTAAGADLYGRIRAFLNA